VFAGCHPLDQGFSFGGEAPVAAKAVEGDLAGGHGLEAVVEFNAVHCCVVEVGEKEDVGVLVGGE